MVQIVPSELLPTANLIIDAIYEGGKSGNASDDPISRLLKGIGNQGGFRAAGQGDQKNSSFYTRPVRTKIGPIHSTLTTGNLTIMATTNPPAMNCTTRRAEETGSLEPFLGVYMRFQPSAHRYRPSSYFKRRQRQTALDRCNLGALQPLEPWACLPQPIWWRFGKPQVANDSRITGQRSRSLTFQ